MLESVFAQNDLNCLKAGLEESCCGSQVVLYAGKIGDDEASVMVDGITVVMDEATTTRMETVTLDVIDDDLVFLDSADKHEHCSHDSCGCGEHGCSDDDCDCDADCDCDGDCCSKNE